MKRNAPKAKKVSTYRTNVLERNKELKKVRKNFSGCVKILFTFRDELGLQKPAADFLKEIKDNDKAYKKYKKITLHYKNGNTSPFAVLQMLQREGILDKAEIAEGVVV